MFKVKIRSSVNVSCCCYGDNYMVFKSLPIFKSHLLNVLLVCLLQCPYPRSISCSMSGKLLTVVHKSCTAEQCVNYPKMMHHISAVGPFIFSQYYPLSERLQCACHESLTDGPVVSTPMCLLLGWGYRSKTWRLSSSQRHSHSQSFWKETNFARHGVIDHKLSGGHPLWNCEDENENQY